MKLYTENKLPLLRPNFFLESDLCHWSDLFQKFNLYPEKKNPQSFKNIENKTGTVCIWISPLRFTPEKHRNCHTYLLIIFVPDGTWDIDNLPPSSSVLCDALNLHFLHLWCYCPPLCCSWSVSCYLARWCSV
jgi:hypothetical protein